MSTEFTWSMKVSFEAIRFCTKDGRKNTGRSKRGENTILTNTPQNKETDKPAPIEIFRENT